jgi:hypothetical protein
MRQDASKCAIDLGAREIDLGAKHSARALSECFLHLMTCESFGEIHLSFVSYMQQ